MNNWIGDWLAPATGSHAEHTGLLHISVIGVITLLVVAIGVVIGWLANRRDVPDEEPATSNPLALIGRHDMYARAIDDAAVVKPGTALAHGVAAFDTHAVDGAAMGTAGVMAGLGAGLRKLQNGYVRSYGLTTAIGVVAVGLIVILGRMA
jgi:NADH-quinone oxidoreductase subunit L